MPAAHVPGDEEPTAPELGDVEDSDSSDDADGKSDSSEDDADDENPAEPDVKELIKLLKSTTKKSSHKTLLKSINSNKLKSREDVSKSRSDSMTVHCLNEYHRVCSLSTVHARHTSFAQHNGEHKLQSAVRLGELFDRRYSATQCTKRDQLWVYHPFLALYAVHAFLTYGGDAAVEKKVAKEKVILREFEAISLVFGMLSRREVEAVNERVIDLIDEHKMVPSELVSRLRTLESMMGRHTLLHPESVLCHRAPNVCLAFSRHELCSHEQQPTTDANRLCGGRHICVTPSCSNRRGHCTPRCSVPNDDHMQHSASMALLRSVDYRRNQRSGRNGRNRNGNGRNGRKGNGFGKNRDKKGANGKNRDKKGGGGDK